MKYLVGWVVEAENKADAEEQLREMMSYDECDTSTIVVREEV